MVMYRAAALVLGASLLVNAETGLAARNRLYNARRNAEIASKRDITFAQIDARATESYGVEDPCGAETPADSVAGFTTVTSYPVTFASPLTVKPFTSVTGCIQRANCENACISDPTNCLGIEYFSAVTGGVTEQSCNLLGLNYGGPAVTGQTEDTDTIAFVSSAGATSSSAPDSSPLSSHEQSPSCATPLDNQSENGACACGPGRQAVSDNAFVCEAIPVQADIFKTPELLNAPAQVYTPITLSAAYIASYSIMDANQCGSICDNDTRCIGYYLQVGSSTNDCYKIGGSGAYFDPTTVGADFTPSSKRMAKRASTGMSGTFGSGNVLAATKNGGLSTSAGPGPSGVARLRSKRSVVNSQVQW